MSTISRRHLLQGLGGAALLIGTAPQRVGAQKRFDGESLRVQFWAGPEGQTVRTGVVDPFSEKTGVKVIATEGWTSASIAKIRAEKANPSTSVYMMDDVGVITAGREGLLESIDLARLPNAVDIHPRFFVEGRGIGIYTYMLGLAYNTNLVKTPPSSWNIMWDPQFKGKISLVPVSATPALLLAIVAAMMNGGNQYNMEPAWDALKALKPNIAMMETNIALLAELLRNGELAMVAGRASYQFKPYIEKGYPIGVVSHLKEGILATPGCAALVKNHPDKREVADAFMNEALGVPAQTKMAQTLWFGPTNRKVKVPPEVARHVISTPDQWGRDHPGQPRQSRRSAGASRVDSKIYPSAAVTARRSAASVVGRHSRGRFRVAPAKRRSARLSSYAATLGCLRRPSSISGSLTAAVLIILRYSFNQWTPTAGMAEAWTASNYIAFLSDPFHYRVLLTTVRVSAIVTVISLVGGYPVAYLLAQSRRRGSFSSSSFYPY